MNSDKDGVFCLQVQTVVKKVSVPVGNQSEPVSVNRKKLEFKWGMNVLGKPRDSCVNTIGLISLERDSH